jgi:hypothetical protein
LLRYTARPVPESPPRVPGVLGTLSASSKAPGQVRRAARNTPDGEDTTPATATKHCIDARSWIIATALVPFALVMLPLVVLLPALLAVQYVNRSQFAAVLGATVTIAAAMASVGSLQAGVGLEAQAPAWLLDALAVVFVR